MREEVVAWGKCSVAQCREWLADEKPFVEWLCVGLCCVWGAEDATAVCGVSPGGLFPSYLRGVRDLDDNPVVRLVLIVAAGPGLGLTVVCVTAGLQSAVKERYRPGRFVLLDHGCSRLFGF